MHAKWIETVSKWIARKAIEDNPEGLKLMADDLYYWLINMGFNIETHISPDATYRPIFIAKKPPKNSENWIGFFHHYDVEPIHNEWDTNPWEAVMKDGFLYGRGIADNFGPLAQRIIQIEENMPDVGLLFVIQGEEEIGSPWAHEVYQNLSLPEVKLWIEETGYFYKDGAQRILTVGESELLNRITGRITEANQAGGRNTKIRDRFLTKVLGLENCPCIAHLLGDTPYLAIGPNDDTTRVHGNDEAIDTSLLPICADHLSIVFEEALL